MVELSLEQAFMRADFHIERGEVSEARKFYQAILSAVPNNERAQQALTALQEEQSPADTQSPPQEVITQLLNLYNSGNLEAVVEQASLLTEQYPEAFVVWNILGAANKGLGDLDKASQAFKKVTKLNPSLADGFNNLGTVLKGQGKLEEAIDSFKIALALKPDYAEAYNNMGNALQEKGKLEEAIEVYYKALTIKPDFEVAYNNIGNSLKDQGKLEEAIDAYNRALALKPDYLEAYNNIGNAFQEKGKLEEAIEAYHKVISFKPDHAEAFYNMGIALQEQNKFDKAIEVYTQAVTFKPDYAAAYLNMGVTLQEQNKLEEAIEAYKKALALKPDYAKAHNNIGSAYNSLGKPKEAIKAYTKALTFEPCFAEAHNNMGVVFQDQGKIEEAIEAYSKALSLKPKYAVARSHRLHQQAYICDWKAVEEDRSLLPELGVFEKAIEPFSVLAFEDAPERHRLRSEKYAREHFPVKSTKQFERPSRMPKRLRIGYFSADFHEHPVTYLMSKVINCHDRSLFEIYGYSIGLPKTDVMREKLVKSVDFFRDTYNLSNPEVIELIQKDKIDIAIDLSGYTTNSRSGIFSYRPAPIQINYLGYPGTMGAKFMDYIIADQNLIPTDFQEFYIEKPIYLPHSYQAQDDSLPIADYTPSRSELGLPDCGFVFCAINNTYKITPQEFDIWMRLLQKIKGSVLWLLESNKWAKDNLLKEASIRGIKPERLIFAEKVSHENYLAQFRQADLYLDTFHYNAGATASNALWAGLPVLSKQGKSYTARMASSLLMALDLPELITTSKLEYESVALELAKNPDRLTFVKQKLIINRISKPLFKTKLFTKHLENGYQQAYQRYFNGKEPDTIIVPE